MGSKEIEIDEDSRKRDECLMHLACPLIVYTESTELMQPRNRTFNDPTVDAQPTSVPGVPPGQLRLYSAVVKPLSMGVCIYPRSP